MTLSIICLSSCKVSISLSFVNESFTGQTISDEQFHSLKTEPRLSVRLSIRLLLRNPAASLVGVPLCAIHHFCLVNLRMFSDYFYLGFYVLTVFGCTYYSPACRHFLLLLLLLFLLLLNLLNRFSNFPKPHLPADFKNSKTCSFSDLMAHRS